MLWPTNRDEVIAGVQRDALPAYRLHIKGIVQGVGFRPYVFRLACSYQLTGWVKNGRDGLQIKLIGPTGQIRAFCDELLSHPPRHAHIASHWLVSDETEDIQGFRILDSDVSGETASNEITPDLALCPHCLAELHDPKNRRFRYPFITCSECGPRYSILQDLPFDRVNTSMGAYILCSRCRQEYEDPKNRRFHAQTISCPDCGIKMQLYRADGKIISNDPAVLIAAVVQYLAEGLIVAVKGIGGFLLLCDAGNSHAIRTLRQRKHRPSKPFAVMYPHIDMVEAQYTLRAAERETLCGPAAPIVLLKPTDKDLNGLYIDGIAPSLQQIGVFLPYAPLLELVLSGFGKPVVATSANKSESAIIYDNHEAMEELADIADYILLHDRAIHIPQDDSVLRFSTEGHRIILRAGRGLSPVYYPRPSAGAPIIFAGGSLLKSTFSIAQQGGIYTSQYLGNTDHYDAQQNYLMLANRLLGMENAKPRVWAADNHPDYFSSEFAKARALEQEAAFIPIQHHTAHFAAVLAENNLIAANETVLGVIWDGTGMGADGQIWGGEFFTYTQRCIQHVYQLAYVPQLLGDKMAKEPRLSALSFCRHIPEAASLLEKLFTTEEWRLYHVMAGRDEGLLSSSIGRLFDAVAAILGLCSKQSYEGEAALLLESAAAGFLKQETDGLAATWYHFQIKNHKIDPTPVLQGLLQDVHAGLGTGHIALKFHMGLACLVKSIVVQQGIGHVALSGGVFQNALLMDLIQTVLADCCQLHIHRQLSPNDENISFGQAIMVAEKITINETNNNRHVFSNSR